MNPLLSVFPSAVMVRGKAYPVAWDVRTCVRIVTIDEDTSLASVERLEVMLRLFYPQEVPEDVNEAVRMMGKFLSGGREREPLPEGADEEEDSGQERPLFSYEKDGCAIYTAILRTYGIDLEQTCVHWWKFLAMMGDLDSKTYFSQLVRLRRGWLNGTLTQEEMDAMQELGEAGLPPETTQDAGELAAVERFLAELNEGEVNHD